MKLPGKEPEQCKRQNLDSFTSFKRKSIVKKNINKSHFGNFTIEKRY
jgi:hypothetical protein